MPSGRSHQVDYLTEHAKQMCDWFVIFLQIVIFMVVGGIALTQKLATDLEKIVTRLSSTASSRVFFDVCPHAFNCSSCRMTLPVVSLAIA
jgi:hypothetical protein